MPRDLPLAEAMTEAQDLSIWTHKPWWCQPWSILLTGVAVVTISAALWSLVADPGGFDRGASLVGAVSCARPRRLAPGVPGGSSPIPARGICGLMNLSRKRP